MTRQKMFKGYVINIKNLYFSYKNKNIQLKKKSILNELESERKLVFRCVTRRQTFSVINIVFPLCVNSVLSFLYRI